MSVLRIAHLSDSHFGTVLPEVRRALLSKLTEQKPDLVLLTGDITQRARSGQFRDAREFLKALAPIPAIAVPGNHDIPLFNLYARFFHPYRGFKTLFKDQLERDFVYDDVVVIGLNSTSRWRHVQGDFDLTRVRRRLEQAPRGRVRIVAFHHPVDCDKTVDEPNLLRNARATLELFSEQGVDLVVGGHIHDPHVGLSSGRYPELPRSFVVGVAGTCLSWRTRTGAPNSFTWIEAQTGEQPRLLLTRWDCGDLAQFKPKQAWRFRRSPLGSWVSE